MKRQMILAVALLAAGGVVSRDMLQAPAGAVTSAAGATCAAGSPPRFPDFGQLPPPEVFTPERVFRLSQDFPHTEPAMQPATKQLLAIDYTRDWKRYAETALAYVLEGNVEKRSMSDSFFVEDNKIRRWYHVPWMHWADNGREGLHGLTPEGPIRAKTLSPSQTTWWQTYALAIYNAPGGYGIGRVWADAQNPDLTVLKTKGFAAGTVAAKLMFTTAPVSDAPFLSNPIEWHAYIKKTFSFTPTGFPIAPREVNILRLLQVDIMVRDPRADATGGWVFITYAYNGLQALARGKDQPFDNRWRNLVPVGLMWGQDPTVTSHLGGNPQPVKTLINPDLKETVVNTDPALPPQHLGFGLRLNGPADNSLSSCKSCHSVSEFPDISLVLPFIGPGDSRNMVCGSPEWMRWFRNLPVGMPFDSQSNSLDNSLSLAISITNFLDAKTRNDGGLNAVQYWKGQRQMAKSNQRGSAPAGDDPCVKAAAMAAR
jgi:hypothetical protein